jgi:membrane protein implicated in regulation of membrane protease activity
LFATTLTADFGNVRHTGDVFVAVGVVGALLLVVALLFDDALDGIMPESDWISGPAIGAFMAAFGLFGWMATEGLDAPDGVGALAGVAGGIALGAATVRLGKALMNSPTDATPRTTDLVGTQGKVVTAVRAGGIGEVLVPLGGHPTKLTATAKADLPVGTPVVVVAVESATKVVVQSTEELFT